MLISLIHPSRGRPEKSFGNLCHWLAHSGALVEAVISLDGDDPKLNEYEEIYRDFIRTRPQDSIIVNNNSCVVEAANHAARCAKGDILVYLSDDFKCPNDWGKSITKHFENVDSPLLIKVDDALQRFGVDVLTIPIMNRQIYERLGYFFNPIYKSMFCDQDLYHVVKNMGALRFCPELVFPHEHYCNGKTQIDETYKRSNQNWNEGKNIYAKRKSEGFI